MSKHIKTIRVNKRCRISNNYPSGRKEKEYLVVSALDGDSNVGFVNAVFGFDIEGQCCEDFQVMSSTRLFGEHYVNNIVIRETEEDSGDYDEAYGKMQVFVDVGEETYVWEAYNQHNGYYGHEITVEVTDSGEKVFDYQKVY